MNSPPAARSAVKEARGAGPRSSNAPNPNYVRVVNPVSNGTGIFRRKKAEHYVSQGRAQWTGPDQLRLVMTHPKNIEAARGAFGYDSIPCGFEWLFGISDGETVVKTARGGGAA